VLLVALLSAFSIAQDAASVNPKIVKVEFENDKVRILRARYQPHQRLEMHSHPAKAEVQITDGTLRIFDPDGRWSDDTGRAGEFYWLEPTRHAVENVGNAPVELIEIEIKKANGPSRPISRASHLGRSNQEPVPVDEESHHRWTFENQYVRVLDVLLSPGECTLFHTHSHDNIAVRLTNARVQQQAFSKDWQSAVSVAPGDVSYTEGTQRPYTHRVKNVGTTSFHVIDIELLQ
jgi:quercetin dioxygenase-like cupin family protein